MAFFAQPLNDNEIQVKFFDITGGEKRYVAGDAQYTREKGSRIFGSSIDAGQAGVRRAQALHDDHRDARAHHRHDAVLAARQGARATAARSSSATRMPSNGDRRLVRMGVKAVGVRGVVSRGVGGATFAAAAEPSRRSPQRRGRTGCEVEAARGSQGGGASQATRPSARRRRRRRRKLDARARAAARRRRRGVARGGHGAGRVRGRQRGGAAGRVAGRRRERAALGQAALDALAKLGDSGALASTATSAFEVLELYSGNRTPDLRQRAVKALGAMRDARVVPTLMARLGDAAPTSARPLARRWRRGASSRRRRACSRWSRRATRVRPAPLALLATPDLVPHIAELAGSVDDGVLATTLGEYVKRPDVPDKLRVDVLRTVANLPGAARDDGADRVHRGGAGEGRSAVEERSAEVARRAGDEGMMRARVAQPLLPGIAALACVWQWRGARPARTSARATPATSRRRWPRPQPPPTTARNLAFLVLGGTGGPRLAAYDLAASKRVVDAAGRGHDPGRGRGRRAGSRREAGGGSRLRRRRRAR